MSPTDDTLKKLGLKNVETKGRKLASRPSGPRAIDREAGIRTKPMKVIVASVSRSGTLSMYAALQKLGLQPYHMAEAIKDPPRDLAIACEAIAANCLGEGKPFGRDEFDRWIGDFDATSDLPMTQLSLDLYKAYPDAKVILSTRDPDRWYNSISSTVLPVFQWRIWPILSYISKDCAAFWRLVAVSLRATDGWSRQYYVEHNENIRNQVPKDNLLEFQLGKDGWPELCKFLDLPVPEGEYPRINDGGSGLFISFHVALANYWLVKGLIEKAKWLVLPTIAVGAWYAAKTGIAAQCADWLRFDIS